VRMAGGLADGSVRRAPKPHGPHTLDHRHLIRIGDESRCLAVEHDVKAERPLPTAEYGRPAKGRSAGGITAARLRYCSSACFLILRCRLAPSQ
jgi:hypothetical protein